MTTKTFLIGLTTFALILGGGLFMLATAAGL